MLLLFVALVSSVSALTCNEECVGKFWEHVEGGEALGFTEGDLATFAFLLWRGASEAVEQGGTQDQGMAYVMEALGKITTGCDIESRDDAVDCFNAHTDEDIQAGKDWFASDEGKDHAAYYKEIAGALANQLAPTSKAAKEWKGLDADTFDAALNFYYVVNDFVEYYNPIIGAVFADDGVECYGTIMEAINYTEDSPVPEGKTDDMAYALATSGSAATDAADACFEFSDDKFNDWGDGIVVTDEAGVEIATLTSKDDAVEKFSAQQSATTATVARLKADGVGGTNKKADPASSAAALSAVVAAVALML